MVRILQILLLFFSLHSVFAKDKPKLDQLELQEEIQRFYTRFTERTIEALLTQKVMRPNIREEALRQYLLYDSEALKMTTGPFPEVNLLDMLVFIKLNKFVIRDWWIPKVWKKDGLTLLKAFYDSEDDLEKIALGILTNEELHKVDRVVWKWRKDHPNQYRVEKIRLSDFSRVASQSSKQMQEEKGGFSLSSLIVNTKDAVKAVDQMALVANRGIFLAQYMPNLIRMHARLGAQEMVDDLLLRMNQTDQELEGIKEVKPMLTSMSGLTNDMDTLMRDVGSLIKTYKKEFPHGVNAKENLREIHEIVDKSSKLMSQMKGLQVDEDILSLVKREFHASILFIALVMVLVGLFISIFWWTGFYIVKKRIFKTQERL